MKTIKRLAVFVGIVTLLSVCTARAPDISVDELTQEGYVSVYSSSLKGKYGPVIIFPERHDSRLIQAEFALALYRLSEKSGLARIALEGMFEGETCNTYRFPELETLAEAQRNEMLLGFLESGDIKAPEFMYLAKNSYVFGIEKKDEYDVAVSNKAYSAYMNYLIRSILIDKGVEIEGKLDERVVAVKNAKTWEEYVAARKNLFSLNEWTLETEQLVDQDRSSDKVLERLNELSKKCGRFFDQQSQKDFAEYVSFYKAAQRRSLSMAENVLRELNKENGIIAMVIGGFASLTMLTKNSFLDEIHKQYVLTARAKGLTQKRILRGHVFRNAMLIVIAGFPAAFISMFFTGSLLIEVIFSLDGLGLLGFESTMNRDYPVIFATLYIFTLMGLLLSLLSDLMYTVIDPRIDFEGRV